MARHRKVDVRMWGDARFRRLSPIPPCGQGLWLFLLTGPHTGMIPGLASIGEAAMSELLGWPVLAFREAYGEAYREGLVEADWIARVIWIRNAIRYNVPESVNVIKSWRSAWDEIPECELKDKAYQELLAFLQGFREAYGEAFAKACAKPSGKAWAYQEQEQEQEQEQDITRAFRPAEEEKSPPKNPPAAPPEPPPPPADPDPVYFDHGQLGEIYDSESRAAGRGPYKIKHSKYQSAVDAVTDILAIAADKGVPPADIARTSVRNFFADPSEWLKKNGYPFGSWAEKVSHYYLGGNGSGAEHEVSTADEYYDPVNAPEAKARESELMAEMFERKFKESWESGEAEAADEYKVKAAEYRKQEAEYRSKIHG